MTAVTAQAQRAFRWPDEPRNLKVLPDSVRGQRLGDVMRGFSIALGVDCAHCHVGQGDLAAFDFASDGKGHHVDIAPAMPLLKAAVALVSALLVSADSLSAQDVPIPKVYAPYAFLIGEWDVAVEGRAPAAVSRMLWGPMKTYIRYSGALLVAGTESPSWEGMLVWNGVTQRVDMLIALVSGGAGQLAQEQGTISVNADGSVVREIMVFYAEGTPVPPDWTNAAGPEGAIARFRHTFKEIAPGRVRAAVLRQTETGWQPSFPGADKLIMLKRKPV